jgi:hypothetical protein
VYEVSIEGTIQHGEQRQHSDSVSHYSVWRLKLGFKTKWGIQPLISSGAPLRGLNIPLYGLKIPAPFRELGGFKSITSRALLRTAGLFAFLAQKMWARTSTQDVAEYRLSFVIAHSSSSILEVVLGH